MRFNFVAVLIVLAICDQSRSDVTEKTDSNKNDDPKLLLGDLSYSYAATDIGSKEGSHIKTITIIKNVAIPKVDQESFLNDKNVVKVLVKVPHFPDFPKFEFHNRPEAPKEEPPKMEMSKPTEPAPTEESKSDSSADKVEEPDMASEPVKYTKASLPQHKIRFDYETKLLDRLKAEHHQQNTQYDLLPAQFRSHNFDRNSNDKQITFAGLTAEGPMHLKHSSLHSQSERLTEKKNKHDVEIINSDGTISSSQNQKSQSIQYLPRAEDSIEDILEDFSDYSMHNVKQIVDPSKIKNIEELSRYSKLEDFKVNHDITRPKFQVATPLKYQQFVPEKKSSGSFSKQISSEQMEQLKSNNPNNQVDAGKFQLDHIKTLSNYDKFVEIESDPSHKGEFRVKYIYKLKGTDKELSDLKENDKLQNKYTEAFVKPSEDIQSQKQITSSHVTVQKGHKAVTLTSSSDSKSNLKSFVIASNPSEQYKFDKGAPSYKEYDEAIQKPYSESFKQKPVGSADIKTSVINGRYVAPIIRQRQNLKQQNKEAEHLTESPFHQIYDFTEINVQPLKQIKPVYQFKHEGHQKREDKSFSPVHGHVMYRG